MKRMSALEWGLLLTLSLLWGGTFFFQKVALAELPPFTVLLGRVWLAAAALWIERASMKCVANSTSALSCSGTQPFPNQSCMMLSLIAMSGPSTVTWPVGTA